MVRTVGLRGYSDVHFTDSALARRIVEHFAPTGRCLEPFKGEGAFLESRKLDSLRELEQRATVSKTEKDGNISKDSASSAKSEDSKLSYGEQKEFARRLRKAEKVVADIESEIAGLEKRIAEVEEKLAKL
jgi:ATP-binding cassette subfamily F protein 3